MAQTLQSHCNSHKKEIVNKFDSKELMNVLIFEFCELFNGSAVQCYRRYNTDTVAMKHQRYEPSPGP